MYRSLILISILFTFVVCTTRKYEPIISDFKIWADGENNVIRYQPKRYNIEYNITDLQKNWALTTYSAIAEGVIKASRDAPPYDVIRELIRSSTSGEKITGKQIMEKVLVFELPYLIMAGIPVLLSLVVPCGGLFYCMKKCRCKQDKIDENLNELDVVHKKKILRFINASMVLTAATLILIGAIACVFASNRIDAGMELEDKITETTLNNVIIFADNTIETLQQLMNEDFHKALEHANNILQLLPHWMSDQTASGIVDRMYDYFDALESLQNVVRNVTDNVALASTQCELINLLSDQTDNGIAFFRNEIEQILAQCTLHNYPPCIDFQSFDWRLNYTGNFTHLPNMHVTRQSLQTLGGLNLDHFINESYNEVYAFRSGFLQAAKEALHVLENVTVDLNNEKDELLSRIKEIADQVINQTLIPTKSNVVNIHNESWFTFAKAVLSLTLKIPCFVMFIMCFLLFGGLLLGQFAVAHTYIVEVDELSPYMKMARTAKDLILSFLWLFFLLSFFINILLAGSVFAGSNMTHTCEGLKDNSVIDQVIDNNETWDGQSLLGSLIHQDPNVNLKLADVLSKCKEGSSIWKALQLDRMFNTSGISNLQKEFFENIPPLESIMSYTSTGDYLPSINISTPDTYHFFRINKTSIVQSTMSVNFDWGEVVTMLRDLHTDSASHAPMTFRNHVYDVMVQMMTFEEDKYNFLEETLEEFVNSAYWIANAMEKLINATNKVIEERNITEQAFQQDHLQAFIDDKIITQLTVGVNKVLDTIVGYGSHLLGEIKTKVGRCAIFPETYENLTSLFCYYATDSVNALWLSLGTLSFITLLFLPIFLGITRHYQIIALDFSSEEEILTSTPSQVKFNHWTSVEFAKRDDCQWL